MGRSSFEAGKRVLKTVGVQAPAVRMRRVQGMEIGCVWGREDEEAVEVMRTEERAPVSGDVVMAMGRKGWCRWTPRDTQIDRRKRERRRGSLVVRERKGVNQCTKGGERGLD